jgi:hypothetical protein
VAIRLETGADRVGDRGLVLDDQYAQGPILRSTGRAGVVSWPTTGGEHPVKLR